MPRNVLRAAVVALASAATVLAGALTAPASAYSNTATGAANPNRVVYAMAKSGDTVFIGGAFTGVSGSSRQHVAAVSATTGRVIAWNPGYSGTVQALAVSGDTVYIGGSAGIKAVSTSGATRWSMPANGTVYELLVAGGSLYAGGNFSTIGGASRARLAKLGLGGGVDTSFNARVSGGRVRGLGVNGSNLVIGGMFTSVGGQPRQFLAQVSAASGAVTGWAPPAQCDNCYVFDLAVGDGRAYTAITGPGGRAVAWDLASGAVRWSRRGDGDAQTIGFYAGQVYVGGHWTVFLSQQRDQVVQLSASSGSLQPFDPDFPGSNDHPGIWALVADSSGLYVGGGFATSTGQNKYARFAD